MFAAGRVFGARRPAEAVVQLALAKQRSKHSVIARFASTVAAPSSPARLLLKNAAQVVTVGGGGSPKVGADAMNDVQVLENHSVLVDGQGRISHIVPAGGATEAELLRSLNVVAGCQHDANGAASQPAVDHVVDCSGKVVLPGFVDGHTHAVFAGDRSHEHAMKLAGATYEEVREAFFRDCCEKA